MKVKNIFALILVLLMLSLNVMSVFANGEVQDNIEITNVAEYNTNNTSVTNSIEVDGSNFNGFIKPTGTELSSGEGIYQDDKFASYYFYNLKNNYGNNTHGSCGYVAAAMMLSYYDTYLNDNIIDEKYDKEGTLPFDFDLSYSHESPGIEKEPTTATTSTGVNKDLEDFTAEEYWNYIEANWQNNFQLYLIKIAEEQYNMYHDRVITLTENGITWNTDPEFPCASAMLHMKSVIEYYLCNEIGYGEDKVTLEYENIDVRNFAISKIEQGQPVMLFLGSPSGCHFVVAYDLDDKGTEDTADDDIYAHYGGNSNKIHININTDTYPWLISAMAINFTNSVNHSHSYNYIGAHNKEYCSCFYSDHPAHECSRYYKEYNETHHTYACDCNPSEDNLFEHNLVLGIPNSIHHYEYCSDCGYVGDESSHNFQYETIDNEYHVRVCEDCGYREEPIAHSIESNSVDGNYHTNVCTICGYTETKSHRRTIYQSVDAANHLNICAYCGYFVSQSHSFEYRTTGSSYHILKCRFCGATSGSSEAHVWTANDIEDTAKCKICNYIKILAPGEFVPIIKTKIEIEEETE